MSNKNNTGTFTITQLVFHMMAILTLLIMLFSWVASPNTLSNTGLAQIVIILSAHIGTKKNIEKQAYLIFFGHLIFIAAGVLLTETLNDKILAVIAVPFAAVFTFSYYIMYDKSLRNK